MTGRLGPGGWGAGELTVCSAESKLLGLRLFEFGGELGDLEPGGEHQYDVPRLEERWEIWGAADKLGD